MERHHNQTQFTKRVVLPSGKTIDIVLVGEDGPQGGTAARPPAEPVQDLHVCIECSSELVHPVDWEEAGPESWSVLLHCPNCDIYRQGVFCQDTVEAFDEELDHGAEILAAGYRRLMRANLADEIELFAGALRSGAILPEDF